MSPDGSVNDPSSRPLLRVIVGSTASGKERLALAVAQRLGGEIVSVDSMKIYRGLDVATAKASPADRVRVPHHCLDLVEPTVDFSAADFVAAADRAIRDIARRGRTPILSGGTAFYYKALLDGLFAGPSADAAVRGELEEKAARAGPEALHAELARLDPAAARKIHPSDLRRLVRALEVIRLTGGPISARQREWAGFHDASNDGSPPFFSKPRYPFVMARIVRDRADVHARIRDRVGLMREMGLEDEARKVYERRAELSRTPLQAVGYKEFFPYFAGEQTWDEAAERLILDTNKLVRGQDTWFRKFPAAELRARDFPSTADMADHLAAGLFAVVR